MSPGSRSLVVVNTGVFAARLTPSGSLLAARYRPVLEGRPAVISFVTVAELGYGARLAGWGPGRLRRLGYSGRIRSRGTHRPQANASTANESSVCRQPGSMRVQLGWSYPKQPMAGSHAAFSSARSCPRCRNEVITGPTSCALSSRTRCPPPLTVCSRADGISLAIVR